MKNSALLIIDIQNDFCAGGALAVKDADSIIPLVNQLIQYFDSKEKFIVATKDWHPLNHKSFAMNSSKKVGELGKLNGLPQIFWPVHCVQGSEGSQFHKELLDIQNVIYKGENPLVDSYSGFYDNDRLYKTDLDDVLKKNKIKTLYVTGLATDYCVKFTVLDALSLGYEVYLVEAAIKGVNLAPEDSNNAIEEMVNAGAKLIKDSELTEIF